jgi:hypothetical protein
VEATLHSQTKEMEGGHILKAIKEVEKPQKADNRKLVGADLSCQIEELGNKLIEKLTSMDISWNFRRNCKIGMLTRNNWKPLPVQIKTEISAGTRITTG